MQTQSSRPDRDQKLFAIGINHHQTPVEVRDKLAFPAEAIAGALVSLQTSGTTQEAMLLSTCNRTEFYCLCDDPAAVVAWWAAYHQISMSVIEPYLFVLAQEDAVSHIFSVTAGLNSLMLGETQIVGQMKEAVEIATKGGTVGPILARVFQKTFETNAVVRSKTSVGSDVVSYGAAARKVVEYVFTSLSTERVLFVGAGEMIELIAPHFAGQAPKEMVFINRTLDRAQALADRFGGVAASLSHLAEATLNTDVIVCCTGSLVPLITKDMIEQAMGKRRHKPLVLIDLAMPSNIEDAHALEPVFSFRIDDLKGVIAEGIQSRRTAVAAAEMIVAAHVVEFMKWLEKRKLVPMIRSLQEATAQICSKELALALADINRGKEAARVIETTLKRVNAKFLHAPMTFINGTTNADETIDIMRKVFGLV